MKVLLVVLEFAPVGGLEIYGRAVAKSMTALGHEVEIWSVLERPGTSELGGVRVRHMAPRTKWLSSLHHRFLSVRLSAALRRRQGCFDLVCCMHPLLAAGVHAGLRRTTTPHWVWAYGTDVWGTLPAARRAAMIAASRVIAISEFTAARLRRQLEGVLVDLLPPCTQARYLPDDPDSSADRSMPVLLTVSRITSADAYKGHDVVLAALPLIERNLGRPVEYRIVGSGDLVPRLKEMSEPGMESKVVFVGKVSDEQLAAEYAACDVFVMPSRVDPDGAGSFWGEGFGIVYIEAAAAGKAVVGSNEGGAPEAFVDGVTGIAVDPRSPEAVAEACVRILGDGSLAGRMGREGRSLVDARFSESAFSAGLQSLFERPAQPASRD